MQYFRREAGVNWDTGESCSQRCETSFRDQETGEVWIMYHPLGHDRCAPQYRLQALPELKHLMSDVFLSRNDEEIELLAAHLSGPTNTKDVLASLRYIFSIREIHPRAIEVFRRYYSPVHCEDFNREAYLEIDRLTTKSN